MPTGRPVDSPATWEAIKRGEWQVPPPPPPPAPVYTSQPCNGSGGVYLYEHANYGGRCARFTGDVPSAGGWEIGDNSASSVRIVGAWAAALHEHPNYQGRLTKFAQNSPDPFAWALGNDAASSIRVEDVPPGLKCEESNTCAGPDSATLLDDQSLSPMDTTGQLQVYPYSVKPCPASYDTEIDPVTIVFYGSATGARTFNHIEHHTGWRANPENQQNFQSWGMCRPTYDEKASGYWFQSRFHIRIRKTARRTSLLGTTTLGTPHHEDYIKFDDWNLPASRRSRRSTAEPGAQLVALPASPTTSRSSTATACPAARQDARRRSRYRSGPPVG